MTYQSQLKFALAVVLMVLAFLAGRQDGEKAKAVELAQLQHQLADQRTAASESARADEHKQANAFDVVGTKFQGDMRYAQALSASTVAGLHDGSLRLSPTWRCPAQRPASVPAAAADPAAVEAADRLRDESAGRIVGLVQQCQAERDFAVALLEAERR